MIEHGVILTHSNILLFSCIIVRCANISKPKPLHRTPPQ